MRNMQRHRELLTVVVPVFNEAAVLRAFHERLARVLDQINLPSEVLYVNDGSTDETLPTLLGIREHDERVGVVNLSRNFGKEVAMAAGLDQAEGSAVVIIDADLQDPPELIVRFIDEWRAGHDVVYGQRISRDGETRLKKLTAFLFYRVIGHVSRVKIPMDTGDFRLLSRKAVDAMRQVREHHRFMKGLFAWIGFPAKAVPYHRDARFAGKTKFNYWKLWNFALEGVTSFTLAPLKLATYVGLLVACMAFIYGVVIIYETLVHGNRVAGYPSLMVAVLFLGSVQLICLGIIGEYLGRTFNETKRRPLYIIHENYAPVSQTRLVDDQVRTSRSRDRMRRPVTPRRLFPGT